MTASPATSTATASSFQEPTAEARRDVETVERFLGEGYAPVSPVSVTTSRSAVRMAAEALGVARQTMDCRIGSPSRPGSYARRYGLSPDWSLYDSDKAVRARAARGELGTDPVLPGYVIAKTSTRYDKDGDFNGESITQVRAPGEIFQPKPGLAVVGETAFLNGEGRVTGKWVLTRPGKRTPADMVAEIREALGEMTERGGAVPLPAYSDDETATVYMAADWHLGLLTWARETGTNWDLKIARETIASTMRRLVAAAPPSRQAVVLGLGDLLHADGLDNRTPASKHVLDVDGRYPRVLGCATRLMIETVEAALQKHETVLLRVLPGNHDPESAVAVNLALELFFEGHDRVTVDASPSPFWWWEFGANLVGATHGDGAKMRDLPLIMADVMKEAWGRTQFRAIHTGHVHSENKLEIRGVVVESHRAPVPADAWHHRVGYGSGRTMTAVTYHREDGEITRSKVPVRTPAHLLPEAIAA